MPGKYFPKWRTILKWVFVLVVIGLAAEAGRLLHLRINARTNAQAVRGRGPIPYTVTVREIIHAPDGTTRVSREITEAVRSDGSIVYRSSTSKGSGRGLYFSSGLHVSTDEMHKSKTTMMNANPNPAVSLRDPNSRCLNSLAGKPFTSPPETLLGEETIAGYRTAKIASDIITEWHALDYGCALVKDRWDFSSTEFTEKELVALVGGEPDATLFDVPANYREVPPSESIWGPKKERRFCNEDTEKFLQMMDEDYKRRAVKPQ